MAGAPALELLIPRHEVAGVVEEAGKGARDPKPEDRVAATAGLAAGASAA